MDTECSRVLQSTPECSRAVQTIIHYPWIHYPWIHYPLLSIIHYPFSIILYPLSRRRQARAGTTIFFIKARSPARNSFRQKPGPLGARQSPARPARSPRKALLVHHYGALCGTLKHLKALRSTLEYHRKLKLGLGSAMSK